MHYLCLENYNFKERHWKDLNKLFERLNIVKKLVCLENINEFSVILIKIKAESQNFYQKQRYKNEEDSFKEQGEGTYFTRSQGLLLGFESWVSIAGELDR